MSTDLSLSQISSTTEDLGSLAWQRVERIALTVSERITVSGWSSEGWQVRLHLAILSVWKEMARQIHQMLLKRRMQLLATPEIPARPENCHFLKEF